MKAFTSVIAASAAASLAAAANFTEVALDAPLNWVVGTYLWPAEIIAGYNDVVDGSNWTESTWDAYVLAACETYTACTSSITWQGGSSLFDVCPSARRPGTKKMLTDRNRNEQRLDRWQVSLFENSFMKQLRANRPQVLVRIRFSRRPNRRVVLCP